MAATLVGGALLSASIQTLIEKLASSEFRDYIRNSKLNESVLGELKITLLALQAVLDDAEEKQISNSAVKQWLDDLKDAIYDAEDLLDKITTHSLRCKVEESNESQKVTNQVWKFLSSPFRSFYREINSQMENMCCRLQLFVQQRDILGLKTISGRVFRRSPTSSLVNESVMVGRKDEKETLMNMLLSDCATMPTSNSNIGVVTILGLGGVGKTTLAQLLYNDDRVQQHFDLKAWACVSEDFDIVGVTKTLLESITSKTYDSNNLDFLQVELKQNLRDKRFLLVLDDLWNEKYNDWDNLRTPLIEGKNGNRVIITTRQRRVAEVTHTFPIQKLEPISDEDCWSILSKHAFGSVDHSSSSSPDLITIGKKIAKKCGGLPIAAKTLGGLMRSNVDEMEWNTILNSNIWDLPNDDILPALRLSYQYLPSHLKRCFAYCSIFPKDYSINRKRLVLLWMAEGFIEQSQCKKELEETGDDYFVELLSRSLIQQSSDNADREEYVMHDLINDLAGVVSGKSCCRLECGNISEKVRHLSYIWEEHDVYKKFENFSKNKCLRSFLPLGRRWDYKNYLSQKVVNDLLPSFSGLRVLSLSRYQNITTVPNSIGNLVQLRYLDLSGTRIKSLPNTICNLHNLQTLILSLCRGLRELPMDMRKLVNLRHLDMSYTDIKELPMQIEKLVNLRHLHISATKIKELPMQIVELENLQTLTAFPVGKQQVGLNVRELGRFHNMKGKLSIINLHNVIDATDASVASLMSKEKIEELALTWDEPANDSQMVNAVLNQLQPSTKLKTLNINSFGGTSFPNWLGDSSFSYMVSLSIFNCQYCTILPPLGQLPSLKQLFIKGITSLETIGPEFYGTIDGGSISSFQPFPSLKCLEFRDMPNWKEWRPFESGECPFPRLQILELGNCPELRGHLPSHLSSLEQILIARCDHLLATPPKQHWISSIKSIVIVGGNQWPLLGSDSPSLVQVVRIQNCSYQLTSLPIMILRSTCLRMLDLNHIPSLTAFPDDGLPTSLQSLSIEGCKNLTFLPCETWCNYTSLVTLNIWDSCHSLTSFPLDGFPALQRLHLLNCWNLESIFISEHSSLHPSSLRSLQLCYCKALRSLPQRMDTLTALEHLTLRVLPDLGLAFLEGAWLPPKLRSLKICSLRLPAKGLSEVGLRRLTALSDLQIEGDDFVNAILRGQMLPISLVSLTIRNLSETKILEGNGLQHLTSLERLALYKCPKLESLPEDKLPSSLRFLRIRNCTLLEERYKSQKGKYWPEIAQIPVLQINDEVTI